MKKAKMGKAIVKKGVYSEKILRHFRRFGEQYLGIESD